MLEFSATPSDKSLPGRNRIDFIDMCKYKRPMKNMFFPIRHTFHENSSKVTAR